SRHTKSRIARFRRPHLPLIFSHPLSFCQSASLDRLFDFLLARARLQIKYRLQRIKFEEITMRLSRRWTGTVVANLAKIVATLAFAAGEFVHFADPFGQARRRNGNVEQNPVSPGSGGSVGIIGNQRVRLRAGGRSIPAKFRRNVCIITGEFLGNVSAIGKTCTGNSECHRSCSLRLSGRDLSQGDCDNASGHAKTKTGAQEKKLRAPFWMHNRSAPNGSLTAWKL